MQIKYDATFDDFVDATLRSVERSTRARTLARIYALACGVIAAAGILAFTPNVFPYRVPLALLALLCGFITYNLLFNPVRPARVRRYLAKKLGGPGPFSIAIELTPSGLVASQLGNQTTYGWQNIVEILDTSDSFDFVERHGGYIVVRKRAFPSTDAQLNFLRQAREYHGNRETEIAGNWPHTGRKSQQ